MTEKDALIAEAELGDEARKFLEGDLGQCLVGMARQEVIAAQEQLIDVNPDDVKAIAALQRKAQLGIFFEQWLRELVTNGDSALEIWKQAKDAEKNSG